MSRNNIKKYASYALAAGSTVPIGLMSFAGMLALSHSLILAVVSGLMIALPENRVYHVNIRKVLEGKLSIEEFLKLCITLRELEEASHNITCQCGVCPTCKIRKNPYYGHYWFLKDLLSRYEHEEHLTEESLQKKSEIEELLEDVQKELVNFLFIDSSDDEVGSEENAWLDYRRKLNSELKRKMFYTYSGLTLSLLSGAVVSYVSYTFMGELLAITGLSALSIGTMGILPVLAFIMVGYAFLIYNAVTDIIADESVKRWVIQFQEAMKAGNYLKIACFVVAAVLVICSMVLTAGTVYYAVKQFFPACKYLAAGVYGAALGFFNFQNVSETAETLPQIFSKMSERFSHFFDGLKKDVRKLWHEENPLQWLNVPRMLWKFFHWLEPLTFVGHTVCAGVIGESSGIFSPGVATGVAATSELAAEAHYFMESEEVCAEEMKQPSIVSSIDEERQALIPGKEKPAYLIAHLLSETKEGSSKEKSQNNGVIVDFSAKRRKRINYHKHTASCQHDEAPSREPSSLLSTSQLSSMPPSSADDGQKKHEDDDGGAEKCRDDRQYGNLMQEDAGHHCHHHAEKHSCAHEHHDDLIALMIKYLVKGAGFLAALWDYSASQLNTRQHQLTWEQSLEKYHLDSPPLKVIEIQEEESVKIQEIKDEIQQLRQTKVSCRPLHSENSCLAFFKPHHERYQQIPAMSLNPG